MKLLCEFLRRISCFIATECVRSLFNSNKEVAKMILHFIILFISLHIASAVVLQLTPTMTPMALSDDHATYPAQPTEILPIQPILIYPSEREKMYQSRALFKDNEIIYIKLLNRKNYRPKKVTKQIDEKLNPHEIQMKSIFYVKALANGQFSHNRLKLYRLPEFYAITVYKKQQFKE